MNITENCPGGKWWKFDFHTHTPASFDYGKGPDATTLKNITPEEWLLDYMKAGIDCVAICDHNSGDWIDQLKSALINLQATRPKNYRNLYLFPGVEISVTGNIHVLAIFSCDKTSSDIERLLGAVGFRGEKGKSNACTTASFEEVINAIHESGGIAIPAHVDIEKGLFKEETGVSLSQILNQDKIFAMEIRDPSYEKPQDYINKKIQWTEIIGSDSHHRTGNLGDKYPGSHYTWIKMSKPDFDGLRLALLDGQMSTKHFNAVTADPNTHSQLVIKNITVENARYMGRSSIALFEFNPWLNSIIGGRGTGKSTTVEFIRKVFSRTNEIPNSLKKDFEKYSCPYRNKTEDGLFTDATKLVACVVKDDIEYRIIWEQATTKNYIEKYNAGNWEESSGDIVQRFPVRIYSQKQIFEMAKKPDALLKIIDESPDVDYYAWNRENEALEYEYLLLLANARKLYSSIQTEKVLLGQIQDIKQKIAIIEKSMQSEILKKYQESQKQKTNIQNWLSAVRLYTVQIEELLNNLKTPAIDESLFSNAEQTEIIFLSAVKEIQQRMQKYKDDLTQLSLAVKNETASIETSPCIQAMLTLITKNEEEYNKKQCELKAAGIADPNVYADLIARLQEYEKELKEIEQKKIDFEQIKKNIEEKKEKLLSHRKLLTEKRSAFLEKILDENSYVKISVLPFGNIESAESEFRKIIHREQGEFEKDIGNFDSGNGIIGELRSSSNLEQTLIEIKKSLLKVREKDEDAINSLHDKRFANYIQGLSVDDIDHLAIWYPKDSLKIEYKSPNEKKFIPVEQGSPGQKTAALLAFILSYGTEPLILDQPEDDLDNQLIYNLIVSQLRTIKSNRQIIVVSHNANIVVNGDSENILVLDARRGQTKIVAQGGLQEPAIRQEICRIMEGGKEAFEQRYKRIISGL